jgi:hypothetical protein
LPLLKNLELLKIQGMDNLNIEGREEAGSIARAALKTSVINQIKELFTDVQELY